MGYYAKNLEAGPHDMAINSDETHEVALLADSILDISRVNEIAEIERLTPQATPDGEISIQRHADINLAIDASAFILDHVSDLSLASRSLRQTITNRFLPESVEERRLPRDELTGLLDKSAFRYERITNADANEKTNFVVLDANYFKAINDRFGHDAGDSLLIEVSRALEAVTSRYKNSTAYRIGGDEFAIITESRKLEQLLTACELAVHEHLESVGLISYGGNKTLSTKAILDSGFKLVGGIGSTAHEADIHMYERKTASKYGDNRLLQPVLKAIRRSTR